MNNVNVPVFYEYMNPILRALGELGGSATIQELYEHVVADMELSDDQLAVIHNAERGNQTEVWYRMAWARTYLKYAGLLENSAKGVWALTPGGRSAKDVDEKEIVQRVREKRKYKKPSSDTDEDELEGHVTPSEDSWRDTLLDALKSVSPDAFERLAQRILRESGFVEVKVTARTSDGGIDGIGLLRLQGVVSFQVLFQCKRWQGSVGAKEICDFRGAMVGRTDKGLFITTGIFSREAQREATRDGAPPIDLIDGDRLLDLMKELGLSVSAKVVEVEEVTVDVDWLKSI